MPKNKRTARKKKRAEWKKLSDPVQAAITKKTTDDLEGGTLSTRPDSSIFVLDKVKGGITKSTKEKKAEARSRLLHSDKNFIPNPFVKVRKAPPRSDKQDAKSREEQIRRIQKTLKNQENEKPKEEQPAVFDLWAEEPTKKRKRAQPAPASRVKAQNPVATGSSYNPTPEAHEDLISEAVEQELRNRKKLKHVLAKQIHPRYEQVEFDTSSESSEEDEEPVEKIAQEHIPRLTRRDRNRAANRKKGELAHAEKLARKKTAATLARLPEIVKEVDAREDELKKRAEKKEKQHEKYWDAPKRLGKHKYVEPYVQVLTSDELPQSFRQIPHKFNLLEDRFDNYRRRNLIEIRHPQKRLKEHKVKKSSTYSDKEWRKNEEKMYLNMKAPERPEKKQKVSEEGAAAPKETVITQRDEDLINNVDW